MATPSYFRSFIFSLLLSLWAASLFGCTEGKRKDSEASVYDHGIKHCQRLAASLKSYGVDLDGNASTLNDKEALLSETAQQKPSLSQIQPLLEDYLLTADRLLRIGDTAVVVFPERESLVSGRSRAVKYLGQVYSQRSWAQKEFSLASSPDVDKAEYTIRATRFLNGIAAMARSGFDPNSKNLPLDYASVVKKMKTQQLQAVYSQVLAIIYDGSRITDLLERNQNWQVELLSYMKKASRDLPIYYIEPIRQAAFHELESRRESVPGL